MILIDANLLLYAYVRGIPEHDRARGWFEGLLASPQPVRLSWATILAFLRIVTNPRIFQAPFSIAEACSIVGEWLARPTVSVLEPGERHWAILSALLLEHHLRGAEVMDAHLAALAIEHGATLYTSDKGFARFAGLRRQHPLER
ncbi:MAG: type II toxin-antitoxin system VapC family toxin [Armatimonadota bacterium]|nr:type II toxin-antitoxin system VapC family toxin [Armatimonadota bacterium]